jgi:hypothetical protein
MIYPLIQANQADFSLRDLCSVLRVSSSGFYDPKSGSYPLVAS